MKGHFLFGIIPQEAGFTVGVSVAFWFFGRSARSAVFFGERSSTPDLGLTTPSSATRGAGALAAWRGKGGGRKQPA